VSGGKILGVAELLITGLENDCAEWPTSGNVLSPQDTGDRRCLFKDWFMRLAAFPPILEN
jgi:hypothetical protein